MSQLFTSGCQSIGTSASVLAMNIWGSFLLGLIGLILLSKGESLLVLKSLLQTQESSLEPQLERINSLHSAFFMVQLSHSVVYMTIGKTEVLTIRTLLAK